MQLQSIKNLIVKRLMESKLWLPLVDWRPLSYKLAVLTHIDSKLFCLAYEKEKALCHSHIKEWKLGTCSRL